MPDSIEHYLARNYPVVLAVEQTADGRQRFAAWPLDLPGCIAQGSTPAEARERLEAMMPAYFEALIAEKVPIPEATTMPALFVGSVGFYDSRTGQFLPAQPGELGSASVVNDEASLAPVHLVHGLA